jgi:hypothetical protein
VRQRQAAERSDRVSASSRSAARPVRAIR